MIALAREVNSMQQSYRVYEPLIHSFYSHILILRSAELTFSNSPFLLILVAQNYVLLTDVHLNRKIYSKIRLMTMKFWILSVTVFINLLDVDGVVSYERWRYFALICFTQRSSV